MALPNGNNCYKMIIEHQLIVKILNVSHQQ